ncbi:PaREP1 family protein [Vulcanisaeta distributa]|uniref:PaREP1 family protein n=1 Tax=Vulcanisaeta distributa (strain DSM 14429 / JCM 11212 / NBRC 100878 / IC-017) TaxID=572478 RepID=E1QTC8_VULDI|nr:PaREP1 family protein [Vulcanisaeta distributa]ADN50921.1 PaREP1 family protein [Vulcanisaeta distributa DSM 14429]
MNTETLEKPLPKPSMEDYVNARLLEALVEARLALEFLGRGLVRNAAGKAFQSWRALLAALLRLELDRLMQVVKTDEERRWLMERAIPRVPTSRMMALSKMLSDIGHAGLLPDTALALSLHDYQYNGPDPDMALSKFRSRSDAAAAVLELISEVVRRIEELKPRIKWGNELEEALRELKDELNRVGKS